MSLTDLLSLIQDKGLGIAILIAVAWALWARIKRVDNENKTLHQTAKKEANARTDACEEKANESRFRFDEARKEQSAKIDRLEEKLYDIHETVIRDVTMALADSTAVIREICGTHTPTRPLPTIRNHKPPADA